MIRLPLSWLTLETPIFLLSRGLFTLSFFLFAFASQAEAQLGIITGAGVGGGPHLYGRWYHTMDQFASHYTYSQQFSGGVRVAACDVNADGIADVVTGAGESGGPHVKVFDGRALRTGGAVELASFYGLENNFTGGVFVACADFNRDGYADVVMGAGRGGGPRVRVVDGRTLVTTGQLASLLDFYAYGTTFTGGVSVAAGDINGDGIMDVITGAGPGGAPHVRAFSGNSLVEVMSFYAYDPSFTGGVDVAVGDIDADGSKDIITGAGVGSGPHVRVFSYRRGELASFYAYEATFTGGVHVGSFDYDQDGRDDIMTGAGVNGGPRVRIFSGANLGALRDFYAYSTQFPGGSYVAGGNFTPPACSDGADNDGDGATDYPADSSCSSPTDNDERNPVPQCADGVDNDGDGLADLQDPGCPNNQGNNEGSVQPQCRDGIDNDGDGAIDYPADSSCSSPTDNDERNPVPQCADGIDNDGDGLIDLRDPGCPNNQGNNEGSVQPQCRDGIDNDGDGAIDYPADFSCSSPTDNDERNPVPQCADGIDNDSDGLVDLQDPGCPNNQGNNEGSAQPQCRDGIDNDGDGATDYPADFSCSAPTDNDERNPVPQCADGVDNDGDGLVDLRDPGCPNNQGNNEGSAQPQCHDGIDNDGDGAIDYPADFSCSSASDNDERNPVPQCADGFDNDGDGLTDLQDPGCPNNQGNNEGSVQPQCHDGIDNDGDGATDYPADFSCSSPTDNDERYPVAQCADGIDNDNDGRTDMNDPGCSNSQDNLESGEALDRPTNLQASDNDRNGIRVTWTAVAGATGYDLYRSEDPNDTNPFLFVRITSVTSSTYYDTSAVPGRIYNYAVRATSTSGQVSTFSNVDAGIRPSDVAGGDSDGDGVSDEQEGIDGTDPWDSGSFALHLKSPAFSKYNTFLSQQNFLELVGDGTRAVNNIRITAFSIQGNAVSTTQISIDPQTQVDLDINAMVNQRDTYGVVKIEFRDDLAGATLKGRMTNYRPDPQASTYSFAFTKELRNPTRGDTFAMANSYDPQGMGFLVPNWMEVINLDSVPRSFVYSLYSQDGHLLDQVPFSLQPLAERDIQAGHEFGQGAYLGVVQPVSGDTKYFAGVSRYSSDSRGGAEAQTYSYAFNLEARAGNGSAQFAPTANELGGCYSQSNWFEVANVRSIPVTATVSFRGENGNILGSSSVTLDPRSQYHFNAGALLPRGERGSISLASSHSGGLISQSLVYFHDCSRNRVQTAYAAQGRIAGQDVQTGSVNSFLGMTNELRLISALGASNTTATVLVRPFGTGALSPRQFTIGANSAQMVSVNGVNAAFAFPNSSYGTIAIQTPQARQLIPSVLRNRLDPDGSGRMDFVIPVAIQ